MSLSVKFPLEPYPVQTQISQLLYNELDKETKLCVIESPTGTGKSYALLVGLTSWLVDNKYKPKKSQKQSDPTIPSFLLDFQQGENQIAQEKQRIQQKLEKMKRFEEEKSKVKPRTFLKTEKDKEQGNDKDDFFDYQEGQDSKGKFKKVQTYYTLPKIVYTSRTHSQLSQIVQTFKELQLKDLNSVAIASKKHMCINKKVKQASNPEFQCLRTIEKQGCGYYSKQPSFAFMNKDIEESVDAGGRSCKCPYYQLRSVLDVADLICVPYSSIISKEVREKIGIDISNAIVVFDEGHNVVENQLESRSIQISFKQIKSLHTLLTKYYEQFKNRFKSFSRKMINQMIGLLQKLMNYFQDKHKKFANQPEHELVEQFLVNLEIFDVSVVAMRKYIEQSHINHKIYSQQNSVNPYIIFKFLQMLEELIIYSDKQSRVLYKHSNDITFSSFKLMVFKTCKLNQIIKQSKMTVIAGGTLSPLDSLKPILQTYSNVCREFDHVINKAQCNVYVLSRLNNRPIVFNHLSKQSEQPLLNIKQIIQKSLQKTHQGIVVFVQSFKYLQKIKEYIYNNSTFSQKCIFDSQTNQKVFSAYESRIKDKKQAILFSVMGGKLSQGINFSNSLARILIVFGLPYPDARSPEMSLKIKMNEPEYLNNLCMKTVNQTIGRAIRHRRDYANILLVDERFLKMRGKLPRWLKGNVKEIKTMEEVSIVDELKL